MSDSSISIVPELSDFPDRQLKAEEIINWLIAEGIIKPLLSECLLGSRLGYSIARGAELVTNTVGELPFELVVNGLEIITERQVFDTGSNGLDRLVCPKCKRDIVSDNWDLDAWSNDGINKLMCPICGHSSDIHQYNFEPVWGFSNLGFTFWNWGNLTQEFIKEFEQKLGCRVGVVYQHI